MSPAFSTTRNVELSTIYYIETQINNSWSGIEVVKSFLSVYDKVLPVICVRMSDIMTDRLELGSTTLDNIFTFVIDIFATSDGLRIDLGDFIKEQLKAGWVYYTHSLTGSTLNRTSAGRLTVTDFVSDNRVDFGDQAANPDRFRQAITFNIRKNT